MDVTFRPGGNSAPESIAQQVERRTMRKAIIVGGSMAGMLAGSMLVRQGWAVEILERTKAA
jgi:monoamine oxidase